MGIKERVQELCREKGVTAQKAEIDLGVAKGYISKLNTSTPNSAKLQKMAEYFGVTTDYLLGNVSEPFFYLDNERILREINNYGDEDGKKPAPEGRHEIENPDIRMIARAGKKMTPEQAENLRKLAQYMFPEAFNDNE